MKEKSKFKVGEEVYINTACVEHAFVCDRGIIKTAKGKVYTMENDKDFCTGIDYTYSENVIYNEKEIIEELKKWIKW